MTDLVIRPLAAGEEELFLSFPDPHLVGPASTGPVRDVFAHTEELARTFLKAPQVARFSLARGLPRVAVTVEEACELLDGADSSVESTGTASSAPHVSS